MIHAHAALSLSLSISRTRTDPRVCYQGRVASDTASGSGATKNGAKKGFLTREHAFRRVAPICMCRGAGHTYDAHARSYATYVRARERVCVSETGRDLASSSNSFRNTRGGETRVLVRHTHTCRRSRLRKRFLGDFSPEYTGAFRNRSPARHCRRARRKQFPPRLLERLLPR